MKGQIPSLPAPLQPYDWEVAHKILISDTRNFERYKQAQERLKSNWADASSFLDDVN